MWIKAVESRARLAIGLFFIGILSTVGLSLVSYLRTSRELSDQVSTQTRLQAALLSSVLTQEREDVSSATITDSLRRHGIVGAAAVFRSDGGLVARGSTLSQEPSPEVLSPRLLLPGLLQGSSGPEPGTHNPLRQTRLRSESGLDIAEAWMGRSRVLVLARTVEAVPLPAVF